LYTGGNAVVHDSKRGVVIAAISVSFFTGLYETSGAFPAGCIPAEKPTKMRFDMRTKNFGAVFTLTMIRRIVFQQAARHNSASADHKEHHPQSNE